MQYRAHKVIASTNILGAANGIIFVDALRAASLRVAFIINKLVPELVEGNVVLVDNCTVHKGKEIEEAINNAGAKLVFLSPYSPDFSPIVGEAVPKGEFLVKG